MHGFLAANPSEPLPWTYSAILMKIHQKADKKVAAGCFRRVTKDICSMKVDPNLTLVKGQDASATSPRRTSRSRGEVSPGKKDLVISRENQLARRLDPTSLGEARSLLLEVVWGLSANPGDDLAEVHLLNPPCLVRLP
jgi:hypothetical protein